MATTKINRKRNPAQSAQDLLLAAVEAFAELGPNATTVEQICQRAGLNKRMAYHYFGSKQALYQATLDYTYQQFTSLDVSLGSMLLPAEELLELIIRRYYHFLKDNPQLVRLISYENLNYGRSARKLKLPDSKSSIFTALELALKKGRAEGRFRSDLDIPDLLMTIPGLSFFYFSNQHTMKQFVPGVSSARPSIERRIRHIVDLLLHGISAS